MKKTDSPGADVFLLEAHFALRAGAKANGFFFSCAFAFDFGGAPAGRTGAGQTGRERSDAKRHDPAPYARPGRARGSNTAQRPRSKRRRGDAPPAPFCCPPPAGDRGRIAFVAAFTRRAQDITASYANPRGRAAFGPVRSTLHKTPLCYTPPQLPAQRDKTANRRAGAALSATRSTSRLRTASGW